MTCAEVTRLSGVVFDNTNNGAAIDLSRITREIDGGSSPCCEPCDFVRASVSLVAVARAVDAAQLPLAQPPDGSKITTLRQVPYIKARIAACDPVIRPLFIDVGQSLVVPWCVASLAIVVPETNELFTRWVLDPPLDQSIPLVGGGGRNIMYDVWLWRSLNCTDCCPDKTATLTDSRVLLAPASVNVIQVPPGAKRATLFVGAAGGTVIGSWHASQDPTAATLGTFSMGSAAFADYGPKNIHVVPGASHLRVTVTALTPITLAWEIQP